jgi:hypothetical protein
MIAKEDFPPLRGWPPALRHVLCHSGLPNIDAELKQLAVNPRRSPERVRDAHLANEPANVSRRAWSSTERSRLPTPIGTETGTVPTDYRLRLDDFERVEHARAEAIEPGKDQTVNIAERHTFRPLALQHIQLMPEHKDLGCLAARD